VARAGRSDPATRELMNGFAMLAADVSVGFAR